MIKVAYKMLSQKQEGPCYGTFKWMNHTLELKHKFCSDSWAEEQTKQLYLVQVLQFPDVSDQASVCLQNQSSSQLLYICQSLPVVKGRGQSEKTEKNSLYFKISKLRTMSLHFYIFKSSKNFWAVLKAPSFHKLPTGPALKLRLD